MSGALMQMSQLAVVLPFWFDRPPLEALEIAGNAEGNGFAEIWIGEMATFEAFALAGAVARETSDITVTVGPLAAGVRTPVQLAMGWSSVTELAQRPVRLALGASTPHIVSGWHGRAWEKPAGRMHETVAMVRALAAGDRVSTTGEFYSIHGFRLRLTVREPHITVAAFGPRMLELAATIADRVVVNLLTVQQVARTRELLEQAAGRAGRAAPPLAAWVPVALDPGPACVTQLSEQLTAYLGAPGYAEMFAAAGFGDVVERARSGVPRRELVNSVHIELLQSVGAIGSIATVLDRLAEYRRAGADTVAIVPATAEDGGAGRTLAAVATAVKGEIA